MADQPSPQHQNPYTGRRDSGVHFHCTGCTFYVNAMPEPERQHMVQQAEPDAPVVAGHQTRQPGPANCDARQNGDGLDLTDTDFFGLPDRPLTDAEFDAWLETWPDFNVGCFGQQLHEAQYSPLETLGQREPAHGQGFDPDADAPGPPDPFLIQKDSVMGGTAHVFPTGDNGATTTSSSLMKQGRAGKGGADGTGSANTDGCPMPEAEQPGERGRKRKGSENDAAPRTTSSMGTDNVESGTDTRRQKRLHCWSANIPVSADEQAAPGADANGLDEENMDWDALMGGPYDGSLLP